MVSNLIRGSGGWIFEGRDVLRGDFECVVKLERERPWLGIEGGGRR